MTHKKIALSDQSLPFEEDSEAGEEAPVVEENPQANPENQKLTQKVEAEEEETGAEAGRRTGIKADSRQVRRTC